MLYYLPHLSVVVFFGVKVWYFYYGKCSSAVLFSKVVFGVNANLYGNH